MIADRLKHYRNQARFTQQYVAKELGIDYTTYGRYENGKSDMKLEHAATFAKMCKISIDELYFEKESSELALHIVKEASEKYEQKKKRSIQVMVELDGVQRTLDYWIDRLTKVNQLIL